MTGPELGFVESENDGTKSYARQPHLNAREEHTLVVDEAVPTQVVRGGIQCGLDGGTFEIGLYDITDGVEGAPLVFSRDVTLPERPLDGGDGYEYDTYTFDLGPIPLYDYAGRELAVAGRHERTRVWGNNGNEPDQNFYRGSRGPLSDSWSGDPLDGYVPRSMGLFVEPVEMPDRKGQTVVGSDILDDRSRTVFAAFSGHSPERGATIQYDDETAAGASVTVLPNGVLSVGQGSSETDSLAVSFRDGDGTWHGPRTVTLTEVSDSVAVTASGDTTAPGGQATLSVTADAVETVTVEKLWTDWTVQVDTPAGGTVQNDISEEGQLTLSWTSVRSSVAPLLRIEPPEETYVGGTYAIEVTATADGDSVTDTALLVIEPGSGGQTASDDTRPTATNQDTTTLVASRGPDGSRLTARPDGPVSHTNEGTVHLFTWDEPAPGARAVLYDEDESTDWGGGPDVHLYDTMERPGASAGDVPSLRAPTGKWQLDYGGDAAPDLRSNSHSGGFAARIQKQDEVRRFETAFPETTEVFLSYCVKIPDGKAMPGADEPGEFPRLSTWKLTWLFHEETGGDVDIVLPAYPGGGKWNIFSNSLDTNIYVGDNSWWQWGEWIRLSFWLECGPEPESDPGRIRFQAVTEGKETRVLVDETVPIMEGGTPPYAWRRLNIPGWADNKNVSGDNVEALYDDIYLATGDDANARIELTDSADYGASTRMQLCDIRSWDSNRVSARLRKGSLDSVEGAVVHLTTAEERQAVSIEVN